MDYYEGVVVNYLRADRALFLNAECCIQINKGENPDTSGPHWYCDAVACDFRAKSIFLCEISYSSRLASLTKRLREWHEHWNGVRGALIQDSHLPTDWPVRPWLFVPLDSVKLVVSRLNEIPELNYTPRITTLEAVQPWRYRSWNRTNEEAKPDCIPVAMRD